MELFFTDTSSKINESIFISGEEAHHIIKVLRSKIGDELFFTDGKGNLYSTEIINQNKNELECKIKTIRFQEKKQPAITLLLPVLKNPGRMEFLLEKITELGVDRIIPFVSENTVIKSLSKKERWERILISTIKQSNRFYLPLLDNVKKITDVLEEIKIQPSMKVFGKIDGDKYFDFFKNTSFGAFDRIILAVGPEGDFSEEEKSIFEKSDFLGINLGQTRLRSETAAICLMSIFSVSMAR